MRLSPGRVLVAPPGHHLLITPDFAVVLIASGASPPSRPSADLLLTTLAIAAGARAVAVVLSGGGHDGATGVTAIHHFGGVAIASNEATTEHFSMARSAIDRGHAIDHVVPLGDLPQLLARVVGEIDDAAGPPQM
jgi:two-component system chemotaxis response regulator CheB